jgi:hypothetical protein
VTPETKPTTVAGGEETKKADSQPPIPSAAPSAFTFGTASSAAPVAIGGGSPFVAGGSLFAKKKQDTESAISTNGTPNVKATTSVFGGGVSSSSFGKGFGASPTAVPADPNSSVNILTPPQKPLFTAAKGSFVQTTPSSSTPVPTSFVAGAGSKQSLTPSTSKSVEEYKSLVQAIYEKHNASKLNDVPIIMAKYQGREEELLQKLRVKYNITAEASSVSNPRAISFGHSSSVSPSISFGAGFGQRAQLGGGETVSEQSSLSNKKKTRTEPAAGLGFSQTLSTNSFGNGGGFSSFSSAAAANTPAGATAFGSGAKFSFSPNAS